METATTRSTVWARLEGIDAEYKRLQEERDAAILERDKARAALVPMLEQVEKLRETVLAQLPKADKRLPSARGYSVTPEMVDGWVEQYNSGVSLTRIAEGSKSKVGTVKLHLERRGIEAKGRRRFGHGERKETCPKCGEDLPEGEEGVCAACLEVDRVVEEHRARVPRCKECGLPFDSPALTEGNVPEPVDGVCGLCQFISRDLAEKRAQAKEAHGNGHTG